MTAPVTLALACALGGLFVLIAHILLSGWIDEFTTALLSLALAAFAAPFFVPDGFDRVWLLVPFAFAIVILPGLLVSILVDAAWRALVSAKRKQPAARPAQRYGRAVRQT